MKKPKQDLKRKFESTPTIQTIFNGLQIEDIVQAIRDDRDRWL